MIKGKDFIVIANPTWELKIGTNIRNMAIEIAKNNRVLYVNPPMDRITAWRLRHDEKIKFKKKVLSGKEEGLVKLKDSLWLLEPDMIAESVNWIPFTFLFKLFNKISSRRYANSIQKAINSLGFKDVILLNDSLMFRGFDLPELLEFKSYVYYIRDNLVSQPYFGRHGKSMEPELIAKSDLIIANSVFLSDYGRKYNPKSFYIGQGYEQGNFDPSIEFSKPSDLEGIIGPIVGYVGTLTSMRLDEQLLLGLALELSDFQFVLVGPQDKLFQTSALHKCENVHFLGLKPMNELSAYVNYFDICINPQLVNDLTIGNYPIKIDEYLSMGKPTVATKTEAMVSFADHTYLALGKEEYIAQIKKALKEDSTELKSSRIKFAADHTWTNSIGELYHHLENAD